VKIEPSPEYRAGLYSDPWLDPVTSRDLRGLSLYPKFHSWYSERNVCLNTEILHPVKADAA